jgi:hypothetical protein
MYTQARVMAAERSPRKTAANLGRLTTLPEATRDVRRTTHSGALLTGGVLRNTSH